MATQTPENRNAKGKTVSIPEPEYIVAVGGAPSGPKAKARKYTGRKGNITSRYLRPKTGSCHDRCKNGKRDEPPELKRPGRRLGVRKVWVKKNKLKRSVENVERKKTAKTKPKPSPHHKICARNEPTARKATQNELKLPKNHVKPKPSSSCILNGQNNKKEIKNVKNTRNVGRSNSAEQVASKVTRAGSSPRNCKLVSPLKDEQSMTKGKLKQFLAEKITEMTLQEAENEELEFVPPTVDVIESPLKDEKSITKSKLDQLMDEKITEMTFHEAENADLESVPPTVEIMESSLKDEDSMTKTNLKQLIAEKITEMTLHEAENADLESFPPTVEIIESPTVITESTKLPRSESSQSSSDKQVSEEPENAHNEEVIASKDGYDIQTSERNSEDKENGESKANLMRGRVVEDESEDVPNGLKFRRGKILEDNEDDGPTRLKFRRGKILDNNEDDGPTRIKFRRGRILDNNEDDGPTRLNFRRGTILEDDEDDGPTKLNFRRGTILEDDEDDESVAKINFKKTVVEEATDDFKKESETVTLKHQEMQEKKEAQELLNRVIEETASKLEVDRKTKVEALVGAFESVISLHDDTPSSQS